MNEDLTTAVYSYRQLIGHGVWMFGDSVSRKADLSPNILYLFHLARPTIEADPVFQEKWVALHGDQKVRDDTAGRRISRETRFEEFGLIIDALYRNGVINAKPIHTAPDANSLFNQAMEGDDQQG